MQGDVSLMSLKQRLERQRIEQPRVGWTDDHTAGSDAPEPPGASLDTRSHAADTHNRRRGFECVRIHYGEGASITLPYIGLGAIDAPYAGKLVLEHSHRTITIIGTRLDALHMLLEQRQVEAIGVMSEPDSVHGFFVEAIRVEKSLVEG